jgi:membrane associated rhomboid family serine protease
MRNRDYTPLWSAPVIIVALNVFFFIVQAIVERFGFFDTYRYLYLSVEGLRHGYVWQLITFQFLHGGICHLLGNCLFIYFFGNIIQDARGQGGFLRLYFTSGVVGGLVQMLLAFLVPQYFGGPVVGASGGASGLLAAAAMLYPHRQFSLLIFFIIPVTFRLITFLWISIGLSVFGLLVPTGHIAHAAHLGGILTGILYVRWRMESAPSIRWNRFRRPRPKPQLVSAPPIQHAQWKKPAKPVEEELPPAEFISKEVDPILDKISAHGIQSLTERERQILEAARKKMAKR